jgi:hypothetical protein
LRVEGTARQGPAFQNIKPFVAGAMQGRHSTLNNGDRRDAFAAAPVFTSLRRGESLWRNKLSCVISVHPPSLRFGAAGQRQSAVKLFAPVALFCGKIRVHPWLKNTFARRGRCDYSAAWLGAFRTA